MPEPPCPANPALCFDAWLDWSLYILSYCASFDPRGFETVRRRILASAPDVPSRPQMCEERGRVWLPRRAANESSGYPAATLARANIAGGIANSRLQVMLIGRSPT